MEVCELGTENDGSPYVPTFEEHVRRCSGRHLEACPFYWEYHQDEEEPVEEYRPEDDVPAVWNRYKFKCTHCGKTFLEDSEEDNDHDSFERREYYIYKAYLTLEGLDDDYEIIESIEFECQACGGPITYKNEHGNFCCGKCRQAHYMAFDENKLVKCTRLHFDPYLTPKKWW